MEIAPETPVHVLVIGRGYTEEEMRPYVSGLFEAYGPFMDAITPINLNQGFEVKEGDPPTSVFLARWRTKADFDTFWESEAYQRLKRKREGVGAFTVLVVPELAPGAPPGKALV